LCALIASLCSLNYPAPPEFYTLSLHDALPIWLQAVLFLKSADDVVIQKVAVIIRHRSAIKPRPVGHDMAVRMLGIPVAYDDIEIDRKSTRLNSSHVKISYAVFCLKKKRNTSPS